MEISDIDILSCDCVDIDFRLINAPKVTLWKEVKEICVIPVTSKDNGYKLMFQILKYKEELELNKDSKNEENI